MSTPTKPQDPTAKPAVRLNTDEVKALAAEGLKVRREIERRAASMTNRGDDQPARARMK